MKKKPAHREDTKRRKDAAKKATATATTGGTTARAARPAIAVREVPVGVFKDKCLELLDGVHEHRYEVIVTKHGKPTARIVAPDGPTGSIWGILRGTVISDEGIMDSELDEWHDHL